VREFTESHTGERIQMRIGSFTSPPTLLVHPNRAGRDGLIGLSEETPKAILLGLTGRESIRRNPTTPARLPVR
jgi:hypothetical protein